MLCVNNKKMYKKNINCYRYISQNQNFFKQDDEIYNKPCKIIRYIDSYCPNYENKPCRKIENGKLEKIRFIKNVRN